MHQVEIATTRETLLDSPEMVLNMGPQHPSTHGVLRVILRLDGETVIDLDCDIGFLHRGMEKIAENRLYRACLGRDRRADARIGSAAARALHTHDTDGVEPHRLASSLAPPSRTRH